MLPEAVLPDASAEAMRPAWGQRGRGNRGFQTHELQSQAVGAKVPAPPLRVTCDMVPASGAGTVQVAAVTDMQDWEPPHEPVE